MRWEPHYASNLAAGAVLAGVAVAAWRCYRSAFWRPVWRRLISRPHTAAALAAFGAASLVALADSIAWRDPATDAEVRARGVEALRPRSMLDRLFPRDFDEEGYSAPRARETFYGGRPLRFPARHWLGTTLIGQDTLHQTLKGFRPAMMIGVFTTLLVVPIAIVMGVMAGYFGRLVDDLVQYIYSTLASIPNILLLIALMLVMGRGTLQVCIALGVTTWVGLCRLIRAETLKLRELDYVQAARAVGLGSGRLLYAHIVPNLFHIVIISSVLRFSGLVLNESILAYFGVGLDSSFGAMIVLARDELAREPVIWWNLAAASTALFVLVLAANVIGDVVRDQLDPRVRGGD